MVDDVSLRAFLADLGYPGGAPLGSGLEGLVHRVDGGLIAKAWFHRTPGELSRLGDFYRELAGQGLPFATPELVGVFERDGRAVTIERELAGTPVPAAALSSAVAQEAILSVAVALRRTKAGAASRALTVLTETTPMRAADQPWGTDLAALVSRRANPVLAARVAGFDRLLDRILLRLRQLPDEPDAIVHGDICPANVLVDAGGAVSGVLDWGFLTTGGDNIFDASLAAGFFDMYGPDARTHDDRLLGRLETEFGFPRDRMLLYRAAYAVLTATAYSADGNDGHFAWCAASLDRADVRAVL